MHNKSSKAGKLASKAVTEEVNPLNNKCAKISLVEVWRKLSKMKGSIEIWERLLTCSILTPCHGEGPLNKAVGLVLAQVSC